ncbi:coiled-coil domain-containing protein 124 isoform X3 [Patagioenas fasciata]|uniref:coiled-coil domain-containing protein 124 isoform X3 n=1 Tax=Patagioenas fasciata TaxID=372321 RepID=UPI003A993ECB
MPKKFQGENTKSAAARARKAEAKAAADAKRQQELEDAYWKDEDKHVMRKEQRKHFGRALNATPALLWEQPSSANRAWRSSGGSVMHKGAAEPMSPARHVRVPPLALRHESPRVTFPGELWLEGTKSPSVLGSSGFYPAEAFLVVEQPRVHPRRSCRQACKGDKPPNVLENSRKEGSVEYLSRAGVSQPKTFCTGVQRVWGKI